MLLFDTRIQDVVEEWHHGRVRSHMFLSTDLHVYLSSSEVARMCGCFDKECPVHIILSVYQKISICLVHYNLSVVNVSAIDVISNFISDDGTVCLA